MWVLRWAAAAGAGAIGVLLYPDPQDTARPGEGPGLGRDTAVTVHVSGGAGRGWGGFRGLGVSCGGVSVGLEGWGEDWG